MRPSCGFLRSVSIQHASCAVGIRPARARGTSPPGAAPPPRPRRIVARMRPGPIPPPSIATSGGELGRCAGSSGAAVMCLCACVYAVRAGGQARTPRASTQRSSAPAAAEPHGFRVAHCQGTTTRGCPHRCGVAPAEVVKPRPKSPDRRASPGPRTRSPTAWRSPIAPGAMPRDGPPRGGAAGIRTPDLRRARAALSRLSYGPPRRIGPRPTAPTARVGAPGLEPGTSALSGPRSDHLSYAPAGRAPARRTSPSAVAPASPAADRAGCPTDARPCPLPKTERADSSPRPQLACQPPARGAADLPAIRGAPARSSTVSRRENLGARCPPMPDLAPGGLTRVRTRRGALALPRKEVIQPQLPLRLPCYDFVPITSPALDGCLPPKPGLAHRLQALPAFVT